MNAPRPMLCALLLIGGCVSRQADHFYVLDPVPPGIRGPQSVFDRQVTLRVTVPAVVDRSEMVLSTADGVTLLDHQRWAAPLADLVTTALSQDIERRNAGVLVLAHRAEQAGLPLIKIDVDLDQVTARLGDQVSVEAHWRVTDARTGRVSLGRETFSAPLGARGYAAVAGGLSSCIGQLADRLTAQL
jgi:uncharacterized protein